MRARSKFEAAFIGWRCLTHYHPTEFPMRVIMQNCTERVDCSVRQIAIQNGAGGPSVSIDTDRGNYLMTESKIWTPIWGQTQTEIPIPTNF